MTRAARLRELHAGRGPGNALVLPGPWDPGSALIFADAGFSALATPSHGVSAWLGYADGECPAVEMFAAVTRIVRAADAREVPVTADIERGYGLPPVEIAERLLATGAVGCNLEDTADGALVEPARQADFLAEVRAALGPEPFLNARVDTYLRGAADPLAEALARGRAYVEAGADGIYPFGAPVADLPVLARELGVPVNAIALPDGPAPAALSAAGATRITYGGGLAAQAQSALRALAQEIPKR
ncbi:MULTISPECIES: isocitrate lyase/phosphoenolpyruvate mutase family protein [unclassified Streptomyces]|uniref:isocitrate lyase/PEP mutase family protein n=1 Tax=unclassified Streptomyces TaxID=2593676 RepID=UPI002DD93342|nr:MULTISPECIES: isocitrate lyase/phosphoenolpyruvate mutase family protein [unclassified Streptomyces]WSA92840.1 isocitrate lyase/phosphoenolpyruvate mutase family protein [Streptomyces sp. NBC_01795]WSB77210.1 isocitrate lyase/phosphoenolpyruvate mutase family protein [Streptomyces sp. NBC_01775]WSS14525.1 isocitrate lyase/phosphoenolpyruvate mutase family protein [Streptomyces sp. NBC_01186]WSS43343.1 isocitrate lyase/phosphoenolpyruvate mutase family protein [Streptomyces sp. NBC_01187]